MKTKKQRFAEIKRRINSANIQSVRLEKKLYRYLNSSRVKKMKKAVQDAQNNVNKIIEEWHNLVLEDHEVQPSGPPDTYTSVNAQLIRNYREDPKSW